MTATIANITTDLGGPVALLAGFVPAPKAPVAVVAVPFAAPRLPSVAVVGRPAGEWRRFGERPGWGFEGAGDSG